MKKLSPILLPTGLMVSCSHLYSISEADLKDLAPAIGDRIHLRSILDEAKKVIILNYFNHCNLVSHSGW